MVAIKLQKEENRKAFLDVFPTLSEEVLAELRKYNMPEDAYNKKSGRSIIDAMVRRSNSIVVDAAVMSRSLYFAI